MPKKYKAAATLLEQPEYPLGEAVQKLTEVSTSSFDGTAEIHVRLGIDVSKGDQQVRATVVLPHGTGKTLRIAAVVPEDESKTLLEAGAVHAGEKNLIAEIEKGVLDFDVLIASPKCMKTLGKVAKTLGQKGLMPNPNAGTVTDDPVKTLKELQGGRIEFRADKQGVVHSIFGKISFGAAKLTENLQVFLQALNDAKPASVKGEYIRSIVLAPTMGPGVRVQR